MFFKPESFFKKYSYEILLLLISILAFWQIFFLQCSLHNDAMDVTLPWRYFAGECLQHNIFPLWNPYQQLGYPFFADMQYSIWYPEELIIGFLFGYNNITLQILFIVYIFLAGLGMFKLGLYFKMSRPIAFIAATAYMLSGLFIGHAQSLVSVLGAVWLPWAICYYLKMIDNPGKFVNILKAIFFLFLMISGGYQAVSFILMYLLLIIFIYRAIILFIVKDYFTLKKLIFVNIFCVLAIGILSTGIIISMYYAIPYVSRLNPIEYNAAIKHPFSPASLISLILPFSTVKNHDLFENDISMRNLYFGILPLLLFIYGLFKKHDRFINLLLIFGIFCLFISFGDSFPFWKIIFNNVPLMNLFKYASFFRYFTLIIFLIVAGITLSKNIDKIQSNRLFQILLLSLYSLFIVVFILCIIRIKEFSFWKSNSDLSEILQKLSFKEHILIQSFIQIIILTIFILFYYLKKFNTLRLIIFFTIIDLVISVQLNMHFTGCSNYYPKEIKRALDFKIKGFPVPEDKAIIQNSDKLNSFSLFWRNTGNFNKVVSSDGFSSFYSISYNKLLEEKPYLLNSILNNKLLYFSSEIYPYSVLNDTFKIQNNTLFIEDTLFLKYKNKHYSENPEDSIIIIDFNPHKISSVIYSKDNQFLTLLQNNFKGWKVYIDGINVEHFTSNYNFISLEIPKGNHKIDFIYSNAPVLTGFYVSAVSFFILIITLFYFCLKSTKKKRLIFFIILAFSFTIFIIKYFTNQSRNNQYPELYKLIISKINESGFKNDSINVIINGDNKYMFDSLIDSLNENAIDYNFYSSKNNLIELINNSTTEFLIYSRLYKEEDPDILNIITEKYPFVEEYEIGKNYSCYLFSENNNNKKLYDYYNLNDFENMAPDWMSDFGSIDTLNSVSGKNSNYVNSDDSYGQIFNLKFKDLNIKGNIIISVSANIKTETDSEIYIVNEVLRDNKFIIWDIKKSKIEINNINEWNKEFFSFIINKKLKINDEIRVYFLNQNHQKMWVDDFNIKILSTKKIIP